MDHITHHYFLSHMRSGLATQVPETTEAGQRLMIPVTLQLKAKEKNNSITIRTLERKIALYGPGDVSGFNSSAIVQSYPVADLPNFRADLIPYISFEDPDFLWRYSTTKANESNNWIPWLSLLILKDRSELEEGEFHYLPPLPGQPAQLIQLSEKAILPDLSQSWRWAHIHVNGAEGLDTTAVKEIIETAPQNATSRLMSPRRLKTKTRYTAFVIPSYQLGVEAAMGLNPSLSSSDTNSLSWNTPQDGRGKIIPYYYKWSFQTGERGDFEYLIRKLEYRDIGQVGQKTIDCNHPGYGLSSNNNMLQMESALQSPAMEYQQWGLDAGSFNSDQEKLATLLNKDVETDADGKPVLKVVPPIYGRWYQSKEGSDFNLGTDSEKDNNWITALNLDYRHRAAAGLGVAFVKENQEELMRSAWKQLDTIQKTNQKLNYARFGLAVSNCMYKRLLPLNEEQKLRLGLPVSEKLKTEKSSDGKKTSIKANLNQSEIPNLLLHNKIKKYLVPKFENKKATNKEEEIVPVKKARLGFGINKKADGVTIGSGWGGKTPSSLNEQEPLIEQAGQEIIEQLNPRNSIEKKWCNRIQKLRNWESAKVPHRETSPSEESNQRTAPLSPIKWYPEFPMPLYAFLRDKSPDLLLAGLHKVPPNTISFLETNPRFIESFMMGVNHEMAAELRWRKFPTDMSGNYFRKFWDSSLYSIGEQEKQAFGESKAGEHFFSQTATAGLQNINDINALYNKTATSLSPEERQLMLKFEAVIEKWLLTRESQQDIQRPSEWATDSKLGDHSSTINSSTGIDKQVVLLLRSDLLKTVPNAVIYLAKSNSTGDLSQPDFSQQEFPVFEGTFPPDIVFLGFGVAANQYENYFLVFEEPLSKTTFGLDEDSPLDGTNPAANISWQHFSGLRTEGYLDDHIPQGISPGQWNNPAFIAKACTQKSVRLAVPLSRFFVPEDE